MMILIFLASICVQHFIAVRSMILPAMSQHAFTSHDPKCRIHNGTESNGGENKLCTSECCYKSSVTPGREVERIQQFLKNDNKVINVCAFGDSTMYLNDHATVNTFVETMRKHVPNVEWTFHHGNRDSPAAIRRNIKLGRYEESTSCHILFIQYHQFANHEPVNDVNSGEYDVLGTLINSGRKYYRNFDSEAALRTLIR